MGVLRGQRNKPPSVEKGVRVHFGSSDIGDIEASYLTNHGFDEALWMPYNQVPSLYVPQGQLSVLTPEVMFPEMFGKDPYDIDSGWRPRGYAWALEDTKGVRCADSAPHQILLTT